MKVDELPARTPIATVHSASVRRGQRETLHDISATFAAGTITLLLGPNGAGKTTLLHALSGGLALTGGTVRVGGCDPRAERRGIGFVPQEIALYLRLTVRENVEIFAALTGVAKVDLDVAAVLAMTHLSAQANQRISTLSGGMQRRANLACALVGRPRLLLLDEPTVGLDVVTRRDLGAILRAWSDRSGAAVLMATHDMEDTETLADQVLVLNEGRLIAVGPPASLVADAFAARQQRVDLLLSDVPDAVTAALLRRQGYAPLADIRIWRAILPERDPALAAPAELSEAMVREIRVRRPGLEDVYCRLVAREAA